MLKKKKRKTLFLIMSFVMRKLQLEKENYHSIEEINVKQCDPL